MSPFEILLGIVLSVLLASTIGFLFSRNSKQSEIVQKWKATQDSKKLSKKQMKIGALTVDDVGTFPREVLTIETANTIPFALKKLASSSFTSVPVFNPKTKKFVGSVDMLDLVGVMVMLSKAKEFAELFAKRDIPWFEYVDQQKKIFEEQTVEGMPNIAEHNSFFSTTPKTSLKSICDEFRRDSNVHRGFVFSEQNELIGVISSVDVLHFLASNQEQMTETAATKISSFFRKQPVVSVRATSKAMEGYELMIQNKVSAIAVINSKDNLIAVLSSTDLKRSTDEELFSDLQLPIDVYLKKSRPGFDGNRSLKPVAISPEDTVQNALDLFSQTKLHRLFVVDKLHGKLLGILTLFDLLQFIDIRN